MFRAEARSSRRTQGDPDFHQDDGGCNRMLRPAPHFGIETTLFCAKNRFGMMAKRVLGLSRLCRERRDKAQDGSSAYRYGFLPYLS